MQKVKIKAIKVNKVSSREMKKNKRMAKKRMIQDITEDLVNHGYGQDEVNLIKRWGKGKLSLEGECRVGILLNSLI